MLELKSIRHEGFTERKKRAKKAAQARWKARG